MSSARGRRGRSSVWGRAATRGSGDSRYVCLLTSQMGRSRDPYASSAMLTPSQPSLSSSTRCPCAGRRPACRPAWILRRARLRRDYAPESRLDQPVGAALGTAGRAHSRCVAANIMGARNRYLPAPEGRFVRWAMLTHGLSLRPNHDCLLLVQLYCSIWQPPTEPASTHQRTTSSLSTCATRKRSPPPSPQSPHFPNGGRRFGSQSVCSSTSRRRRLTGLSEGWRAGMRARRGSEGPCTRCLGSSQSFVALLAATAS
jgi:hypothetical protein